MANSTWSCPESVMQTTSECVHGGKTTVSRTSSSKPSSTEKTWKRQQDMLDSLALHHRCLRRHRLAHKGQFDHHQMMMTTTTTRDRHLQMTTMTNDHQCLLGLHLQQTGLHPLTLSHTSVIIRLMNYARNVFFGVPIRDCSSDRLAYKM
jgi:DNA-directed RNA polymerase subunit N (RpoN/RPB10)